MNVRCTAKCSMENGKTMKFTVIAPLTQGQNSLHHCQGNRDKCSASPVTALMQITCCMDDKRPGLCFREGWDYSHHVCLSHSPCRPASSSGKNQSQPGGYGHSCQAAHYQALCPCKRKTERDLLQHKEAKIDKILKTMPYFQF